jgi:hypothetical protein
VNKVRTKDRDILAEPRQHWLADAKCLDRFLIGTGQQMLIMRHGQAEHIAKNRREDESHGYNPFHQHEADRLPM